MLAAVVLIASVIGVVGAVVDSERPGYWFFVVVSILAVVSAAIFLVFAVVRKPPIVPVGGDADRR